MFIRLDDFRCNLVVVRLNCFIVTITGRQCDSLNHYIQTFRRQLMKSKIINLGQDCGFHPCCTKCINGERTSKEDFFDENTLALIYGFVFLVCLVATESTRSDF